MKSKLLIVLFVTVIFNSINAQISMLGTAIDSELVMAQFSLYEFQQQANFTTGTIKFRQGKNWSVNWGSDKFPSGNGVQNGLDIPVTAGTYIVSFNSSTGAYSFVPTTATPIITIVGTGVNGWPPTNGPEITLSTTDNATYTISDLLVSNGSIKFRQDYSWTTNWGGNTFPNGQGILNDSEIVTQAGIYDVTFNRTNGTYTFVGTPFVKIGIWGPAVDSQNGYTGPGVDMTSVDGKTYTLSGFYFSSGNAYFRQDNNGALVWGSTAFPSGKAIPSGPPLSISGNEWFVLFNIITGEYSFIYPSIGILGTALNGFDANDVDLSTNDGFNYSISNLKLNNGLVKFRKDNLWTSNWGGSQFPSGTGTQNGVDIPVTEGTYTITFEKSSGNYSFSNTLSNSENSVFKTAIYPNPTNSFWNISSSKVIDSVFMYDTLGKLIQSHQPKTNHFEIDCSPLNNGVYFIKITSGIDFSFQKVIKN